MRDPTHVYTKMSFDLNSKLILLVIVSQYSRGIANFRFISVHFYDTNHTQDNVVFSRKKILKSYICFEYRCNTRRNSAKVKDR